MSIVPLVKATLYGPLAEKDAVLDGLQRLGCLHLNDLRPGTAEAPTVADAGADARAALQYLDDSPVHRRARRPEGDVDLQAVGQAGAAALDVPDPSPGPPAERGQWDKWMPPRLHHVG